MYFICRLDLATATDFQQKLVWCAIHSLDHRLVGRDFFHKHQHNWSFFVETVSCARGSLEGTSSRGATTEWRRRRAGKRSSKRVFFGESVFFSAPLRFSGVFKSIPSRGREETDSPKTLFWTTVSQHGHLLSSFGALILLFQAVAALLGTRKLNKPMRFPFQRAGSNVNKLTARLVNGVGKLLPFKTQQCPRHLIRALVFAIWGVAKGLFCMGREVTGRSKFRMQAFEMRSYTGR